MRMGLDVFERKFFVALMVVLAGCGGGGGGTEDTPDGGTGGASDPADTVAPTVLSHTPSTGEVERGAEVAVTFAEAMDPASVDAVAFRLVGADTQEQINGTVSYDPVTRRAKLVPSERLALLASYTAHVSTEVADVAGNRMEQDYTWSFRTADGVWSAAAKLEEAYAEEGSSPVIATDARGDMTALWSAKDPNSGFHAIWTRRYSSSQGWSAAQVLSLPGPNAVLPQAKVDQNGNVLAVWGQNSDIWSAQYINGQGWQAAARIEVEGGAAQFPELAMDGDGNAIAIWAQQINHSQYAQRDAWAATFTPSTGWQAPQRLGGIKNGNVYGQASDPSIAFDEAGNAVAVWVQSADDNPVWFARYSKVGGWGSAQSVGATRIGDPANARVAIASTGEVIALWNTFVYAGGPYRFDLWAARLPAGEVWDTPLQLETDDAGSALFADLASDGQGRVHAVWVQYLSDYTSDILMRTVDSSTGWGASFVVSSHASEFHQQRHPSIVVDPAGNVMVAWSGYGSGADAENEGVFARRYDVAAGWRPIVRITAAGSGPAANVKLGLGTHGDIGATWTQLDEFRSDGPTWAARFQ